MTSLNTWVPHLATRMHRPQKPPHKPKAQHERSHQAIGVKPVATRAIIGPMRVILILASIPSLIQKWRSMREVGFSGVSCKLFSAQWKLFGSAFVVALLYVGIHPPIAGKNCASVASCYPDASSATWLRTEFRGTELAHVRK